VLLPKALNAGDKLELDMEVEGDYMRGTDGLKDCYYPRSNTSWYPRHGYLDRSSYDLTFRHPKRLHVASVGARVSEEPDAEDKDGAIAKYKMQEPVALVTFALAHVGDGACASDQAGHRVDDLSRAEVAPVLDHAGQERSARRQYHDVSHTPTARAVDQADDRCAGQVACSDDDVEANAVDDRQRLGDVCDGSAHFDAR